MIKRAALFTGGAITGALVSAAASYGVVSVLFPRTTAPAAIAPAQPVAGGRMPGQDGDDIAVVAASVPAAPRVRVDPIEPALRLAAIDPRRVAPDAAPAPLQPTAPAELAELQPPRWCRPAPAGDIVVTTKNRPEIELPVAPESPGDVAASVGDSPASHRP